MRLLGKGAAYMHICHMCQGKTAKRLHRQVVKSQKAKEKRAWRKESTAD
jgi:hypothetical protein